MKKGCLVVLLAVACAACGRSPAAPSVPASIAGLWQGEVAFTNPVNPGGFSTTGEATITQSDGMASGEVTTAASAFSLTFTGVVTVDAFDGTITLRGTDGCVSSGRLSGSVSARALKWSSTVGAGCSWFVSVGLTMTRE